MSTARKDGKRKRNLWKHREYKVSIPIRLNKCCQYFLLKESGVNPLEKMKLNAGQVIPLCETCSIIVGFKRSLVHTLSLYIQTLLRQVMDAYTHVSHRIRSQVGSLVQTLSTSRTNLALYGRALWLRVASFFSKSTGATLSSDSQPISAGNQSSLTSYPDQMETYINELRNLYLDGKLTLYPMTFTLNGVKWLKPVTFSSQTADQLTALQQNLTVARKKPKKSTRNSGKATQSSQLGLKKQRDKLDKKREFLACTGVGLHSRNCHCGAGGLTAPCSALTDSSAKNVTSEKKQKGKQ